MLNIHKWLSRTTLDIIGEGAADNCSERLIAHIYLAVAGFGFQFGALDDAKNRLSQVYDNLLFVNALLVCHLQLFTIDAVSSPCSIRTVGMSPSALFGGSFLRPSYSTFATCPAASTGASEAIKTSCASLAVS